MDREVFDTIVGENGGAGQIKMLLYDNGYDIREVAKKIIDGNISFHPTYVKVKDVDPEDFDGKLRTIILPFEHLQALMFYDDVNGEIIPGPEGGVLRPIIFAGLPNLNIELACMFTGKITGIDGSAVYPSASESRFILQRISKENYPTGTEWETLLTIVFPAGSKVPSEVTLPSTIIINNGDRVKIVPDGETDIDGVSINLNILV